MPTVTIGSDTFNVYVDQATAATYFNGRAGGAVWLTYVADDRARGLVSATRLLDLQSWVGTKTSPSQPIDWPRDGVVDRDGAAIANTVFPPDIQAGCCELALALLQDPTLQESSQGSSSNTKKLEAKGVAIEYFAPVDGARLPTACYERVAFYYTSSSGASYVATKAFGVCTTCCYTECQCPQIFPGQYNLVNS